MIPDERLKKLIEEIGIAATDNSAIWGMNTGHGSFQVPILSVLKELLSLREQKRKLVVDSERLADEIRDKLYPDNDGNVELVLHESLMKELDESIT